MVWNDSKYDKLRKNMVLNQIISKGRDIKDSKVIDAMLKVPRHLFVPENVIELAYQDNPLPIGENQTISQPYIVAFMTEALNLSGKEKVLEIGTGSGYQAAILAEILKNGEIYTIEIIESLAEKAKKTLEALNYKNVHIKRGDGYKGWEEFAPFDAIIVTCAPSEIPEPLKAQLKIGGKMIIPVGTMIQYLVFLEKVSKDTIVKKKVLDVRFVPMTGKAQENQKMKIRPVLACGNK